MFEQNTPVDSQTFAATIPHVYDVTKVYRRQGTQRLLFYSGLAFVKCPQTTLPVNYDDTPRVVSNDYQLAHTDSHTTISITTTYYINDNLISKTITLNKDGTWSLSVGGRMDVDLAVSLLATVPAIYQKSSGSCSSCKFARASSVFTARHIEWRRATSRGIAEPKWHSKGCQQVMGLHINSKSCRPCQKIPTSSPSATPDHRNEEDSLADTELREILQETLPHCPQPFQ